MTQDLLTPFDFQSRTRIVYGPETLEEIGKLAAELGATRALVVTDPGIIAAGHTERALRAIEREGIETEVFSDVIENPTTATVDAGVAAARLFEPDLLIGLGGGSSMDCAKGINFIVSCGGTMKDYWGTGKATAEMLPMIAVPTTAGTGSETQSFALISDAETHVKMACGDKRAACAVAILDPTLTITMPNMVAADTGIDAISHAVETWVTRRRNPISEMFSRRAWSLLARNFERVFERPDDLEARGAMLLGASLAGLAIENSMLGATHAAANPLTAHFGTVHGQAVGILLPHVVRRNAESESARYRDLLAEIGGAASNGTAGAELARRLEALLEAAELPKNIRSVGVKEARLEQLARDATQQWTGKFNPIALSESDYLELYQCAW